MADSTLSPLRRCAKCGEHKSFDQYYIRKNGPGGWCKPCTKAYHRAWYLRNGESVRARVRQWSRDNPELKRTRDKAYQLANAERLREKAREWGRNNQEKRYLTARKHYLRNRAKADAASKKWIAENIPYVRARSRRIKTKRKECEPSWAGRDAVAEFYREAARLTKETGIPHEVDHIVPLISDVVCGLHWEGNLRVVTRSVNRSKHNRLLEDA